MREAGHNVTKFINVYRGLLDQLNQVGQTFEDGKAFVEEAFLDHPDEQFVRLVKHSRTMTERTPLATPWNSF
jgi:hypothetical protein